MTNRKGRRARKNNQNDSNTIPNHDGLVLSPATQASQSSSYSYLQEGAKSICHFIYDYAVTLCGMKILILFTFTYAILYCTLFKNEETTMYCCCTGKFLLLRWVSCYMYRGNELMVEGVIILFNFVTAVRFNIFIVAVLSSALTLLVVISSVTSSALSIIKLIFRFVHRVLHRPPQTSM